VHRIGEDLEERRDPLDLDLGRNRSAGSATYRVEADELMALKADLKAGGIQIFNAVSPDELILAATATVYVKAFMENLGKNHAEALNEAVRALHKKGKTKELLVGPDEGAAAILVITGDTPDEARLAVLDLDVTAEDVRGQYPRRDREAYKWRPEAKGTETTHRTRCRGGVLAGVRCVTQGIGRA
jgi:hypothetical protein